MKNLLSSPSCFSLFLLSFLQISLSLSLSPSLWWYWTLNVCEGEREKNHVLVFLYFFLLQVDVCKSVLFSRTKPLGLSRLGLGWAYRAGGEKSSLV
ncbi:hypothetical protein P153DRAFT_158104 [Dothidotthia symphoricarpi CBS 119687]|uniref:Secreted protein n=1 Tax=Dothidotthia symphoricarpi CBS 119687 TaxID=1392245 RepID=A0A6A6AR99_9PLEO|nr:uncharacterized protein P153DRAFT_158104 [Dothidotthia symphoricarpi CBS 119687]KAF2133515.1 hypothetical protein P153DRAFT_158104 [Dothidotthia symphoricarpi CBS 119687]